MSGVSREEAVALGEGVTAGPWSTGGHHFPSDAITLLHDGAEVGDIPLDQSDRIVTTLNLGAAAPRLRETVVELHDRVAELTADSDALRRETHELRVAFGRQITEQARARLTPDERLACLRSEAASLARILDALPPGISRQSAEARLAEVEREIAECGP